MSRTARCDVTGGDEVGQRVEPLLLAERQHRLIDQPQRHLAGERLAVRVRERDLDVDVSPGRAFSGIVERDVDLVLDRVRP